MACVLQGLAQATGTPSVDDEMLLRTMKHLLVGVDNSARTMYIYEGREFTEFNPIIPTGEVLGSLP